MGERYMKAINEELVRDGYPIQFKLGLAKAVEIIAMIDKHETDQFMEKLFNDIDNARDGLEQV